MLFRLKGNCPFLDYQPNEVKLRTELPSSIVPPASSKSATASAPARHTRVGRTRVYRNVVALGLRERSRRGCDVTEQVAI